jgi:hypothetical protein
MAGALRQLRQKRRARALAAAALALVGSIGDEARAEPRPVRDALEVASGSCLTDEGIAQRLSRWMGGDVVDGRLAIELAEVAGGVRFVVRREGRIVGERTLEVQGTSCEETMDAAALALASAIDAASRPEEPADVVEATAAEVEAQARAAEAARARILAEAEAEQARAATEAEVGRRRREEQEAARPRTVAFALDALLLVGVLPEVAFGASVATSLRLAEHVDLRLSGMASATVTADLSARNGETRGSADVALYGGRLDGCGGDDVLEARVRIRACGGLVVAAVPTEGVEVVAPQPALSSWVAVAARVDALWTPGRSALGLGLAVEGFVPASRPELETRNADGDVLASREFPLIGVGISLGPALRF